MSKVYVVDDDAAVRDGLAALLETEALEVECYPSADALLQGYRPSKPECLVLDMRMPGMSGLELQAELARRGVRMPIVFLTAFGDIPTTVRAIKAGALDFLTKPVEPSQLLERIRAALLQSENDRGAPTSQPLRERLAGLSDREREVLELAIAGMPNKDIARRLGISHRTVEIHRTHGLRKAGAASLLELMRLTEADRE
jgi:FixJ family two-component response regulator